MSRNIKHIILCSQQFGNYWSGLGTYSTELAKGLIRKRINVTVITPGTPIDIEGLTVIQVKPSKWDTTHGGWFSLSYAYAKALKKLDADLVHFTDARESLAYRGDIPAIGTLHDDYFARHRWNPFHYKSDYVDWAKRWFYYSFVRFFERKALKRLSGLLANSNSTARTISSSYAISKEDIQTVYLGMDLNINPVNDDQENHRLANPKLLLVGGNIQRKGLLTILKAMALLNRDITNLKLQVVGKNQNIEKMKRIAAKLKLDDSVEFLGWVHPKKIHHYYEKSAIFVMPSLMEGFGLVFLEAMSNGLPVIGSNVGGIPELIQDKKNGLMVESKDPDMLKSKILLFLKDGTLRKSIIDKGYNTVKEFSIEKMVHQTIQYYENILWKTDAD